MARKRQKEAIIKDAIKQYLECCGYKVKKLQENHYGWRGVPDLIVFDPVYEEWGLRSVYWIEVKTPEGRLTDLQKEAIAFLEEMKQRVFVFSSIDECIKEFPQMGASNEF